MASNFTVDDSEIQEFISKLGRVGKREISKAIGEFFDAMGITLLDIVQDEIIRRQVVNTRLLLNSFNVGNRNNEWEVKHGGLTLQVGTKLKYASYVNGGHWTNPRGEETRFIPGYWAGNKFIYVRGYNDGMLLTQQWVPGSHYWDSAIRIFERIFEAGLDAKLQEWLDDTFE